MTHNYSNTKTEERDSQLVHWERAKYEIAQARNIDEVKNIRDKAEALRVYAKQVGETLEVQNNITEIKLRAERRAGELLAEMPKNEGGRPSENPLHDATGFDPLTLDEMGIERTQAHRWQRIAYLSNPTLPGHVRHVLRYKDHIVARMTRFDVSEMLAQLTTTFHTVIYTSATLSTGGDFEYFKRRNGIQEAETLELASPFEFRSQCLLYLPIEDGMPVPDWRNRNVFDRAALKQMAWLIHNSRGGALLLFTSHYAMNRAADYLELHAPFPVMRQGAMGKARLIEWLKATPDAVLCATASFWQGIDVPGDALRLVVIDKIPFAQPGPVEKARQDAAGPKAFIELSVPEATLRLKQGFGRLIRTRSDRGVVAILDPRLWSKGYGKRIVGALPDARVATNLEQVREFFNGQ